jgi:hypothetical protein
MNYTYKDAGVTHRQFNHWVSKGWVPGIHAGVGTGHRHWLTAKQKDHLFLMGRLVELGMTPSGAFDMVTKGRAHDVIWAMEGKNRAYAQ